MRFVVVFSLCFLVLAIGCTQESNQEASGTFQSETYGFSFDFPQDWNEIRRDLPNQWAIVKEADTIIFTVNDAQLEDLLALGKIQAIRDTQTTPGKVSNEIIAEVDKIVHLSTFNNKEWYTYAIEFPEKNVNSVVSGTLCGTKEIAVVLVSNKDTYEPNRDLYISLLNSFSC